MTNATEYAAESDRTGSHSAAVPRARVVGTRWIFAALWAVLLALVVGSLLFGRYTVPLQSWWGIFTDPDSA